MLYQSHCSGWASLIQNSWLRCSQNLQQSGCAEDLRSNRLASAFKQRFLKGVDEIGDVIRGEVERRVARLDAGARTKEDSSSSSSEDELEDDDPPAKGNVKGHSARNKAILERAYQHTQNITHAEKIALAEQTGLKPRQVTIWFQNRRNRAAKKAREQAAAAAALADEDDEDDKVAPATRQTKRSQQERKRKLATLNPDTAGPRRPQATPSSQHDNSNSFLSFNVGATAAAHARKRSRIEESRSPSAGSSCSDASAASALTAFSYQSQSSATTYTTHRSDSYSSTGYSDNDDSSSVFGETSVDVPLFRQGSGIAAEDNDSQPQSDRQWVDACKSSSLANALNAPVVSQPGQVGTNHGDDLVFPPDSNVPRYDLSDLDLSSESLSQTLQDSYEEAVAWSKINTMRQSWQHQPQLPSADPSSQTNEDEWEDVEMDQGQPPSQPFSATKTPRKNKSRSYSSTLGMAILESPSRNVQAALDSRSKSDATPTQDSFDSQPSTWNGDLGSSLSGGELSDAWLAELEAMLSSPDAICIPNASPSQAQAQESAQTVPQQPIPAITLTDIEMSESDRAAFSWAQIVPASDSALESSGETMLMPQLGEVQHEAQPWFDPSYGFVPPPLASVSAEGTFAFATV
ncbi:hypothetical protein ACQY0O_007741 [Thecaphora frezii]